MKKGKRLLSLLLCLVFLLSLAPTALAQAPEESGANSAAPVAAANAEECVVKNCTYHSDRGFSGHSSMSVPKGSDFGFFAEEEDGYIFRGWYRVTETDGAGLAAAYGELLCASLEYVLIIEEDISVVSVYELDETPIGSGSCGAGLSWTYNNNTLNISGSGPMDNYESASDTPWKQYSGVIQYVIIGGGVTTIGDLAFTNCDELFTVSMPQGLRSIGESAFEHCTELRSAPIPDSVTSIGKAAFDGCRKMEGVNLPTGIREIGERTFYGCSSISQLRIPEGVVSIGLNAFSHCSSLKQLTLPKSLRSLGDAVFNGCTGLTSVTISEGITALGDSMFYGCSSLTELVVPASVSSVGADALCGCTSMRTIRFLGHAPSFEMRCFRGVSATAWYPANDDSWTEEVRQSYGGNITWREAQESLTITGQPKSVTVSEGTRASFTVAATGATAYQWQWSADGGKTWKDSSSATVGYNTATLQVAATVARNGYRYRCAVTNGLETVYSEAATLTVNSLPVITAQPKSVRATVGETAKFTVTASGTGLSYQWQWRSGASGTWANSGQTGNKTATLSVPATLARNGHQYRCVVSNSGGRVNSQTATLTVTQAKPTIVTQPKSVSAVAGSTAAFTVEASGTGLSYQWQWRSGPSGTWANSSREGNKTATLSVPATLARNGQQYRCVVSNSAGTAYSKPATLTVEVGIVASGTCGEHLSWTLDSNWLLTISGTGEMYDYIEDQPWEAYEEPIRAVSLAQGVTYIGARAFSGCRNLETVAIGETVVSIGEGAFIDCVSLGAVTIPASVTTIGTGAFFGCKGLAEITIPGSVTSFGNYAFEECSGLTKAVFSEGLASIPYGAFYNCSSLHELLFLGDAPSIVHMAFYGVTATATYPAGNATWTSRVRSGYGGVITWKLDNPVPVIFTQPKSVTLGQGDIAEFTVAASGENIFYQWQWSADGGKTWKNSSSATFGYDMDTLQVYASMARNGYRYRCVLTNSDGSATSEAATLTVSATPVITAQPENVTATAGEKVSFTVAASGSGLNYQWQWSADGGKTWKNSSSATAGYNTATLQVSATAARSGYRYRCVISNGNGSVNSAAAVLTVK